MSSVAVAAVRQPEAVSPDLAPTQSQPTPLRVAPTPRRRIRVALTLSVVLTVGSLFALVGINVVIAQGQFELDRLSAEAEAEQRRYEDLRLEVAQLVAPENVVRAAEDLGLVGADTVEYLDVPIVGVASLDDELTQSTLATTWTEGKSSLGAGR